MPVPTRFASTSWYTNFAVYDSLVFSTGGWLAPALIYDTHPNGLFVITDWTIVLNALMSAIGFREFPDRTFHIGILWKSAIFFISFFLFFAFCLGAPFDTYLWHRWGITRAWRVAIRGCSIAG